MARLSTSRSVPRSGVATATHQRSDKLGPQRVPCANTYTEPDRIRGWIPRTTMARIVAGFASSHTPLMSLPGQDWAKRAEDDKRNRELIRPTDGAHVNYDELLASADPKIATDHIHEDVFVEKYEAIQQSLDELKNTFCHVNPDVVVMFGDDQDELFFDDNYPMISVYWGDILTHYPRIAALRPDMSEAIRISASVYGTEIIDYPIEQNLGLHVVSAARRARLRRRPVALHERGVRRNDRTRHLVPGLPAQHQAAPAGHGPRVLLPGLPLVRRQAARRWCRSPSTPATRPTGSARAAPTRWAAPSARPSRPGTATRGSPSSPPAA